MLIDLTLEITPKMAADAQGNEKKALVGHLGTHFDVMNKVFPLEYTRRQGRVFDVSDAAGEGREIGLEDINLDQIEAGMFAAFYSGFMEKEPYGSRAYFTEHPQLSQALIDGLLQRGVALIAIDFAGVRRGREHTPADQLCADRNTFVIENVWGLGELLAASKDGQFTAHTYPMRYAQMTGLPCRVVAEV